MDAAAAAEAAKFDESGRERTPRGLARLLFLLLTLAAISVAIHQLYNLAVFGIVLIEGRYLYVLAGCELVAILLGVGLIVGAFSATGLAGTLVNDLVFLAGGSTIALLVMGALTAFIFGMGMTVTACYIFLAIVLAPALERAGLDTLAVHLFILYWGMVSYITPPVALGAFAAATLARTSPMRVGLEAMKLGGVIYLAPFYFVLSPALIGHGSTDEVLVTLATALLGIWLFASALQGSVCFVGRLPGGALGLLVRLLLLAGGVICAAPGGDWVGLSHLSIAGIGLAIALPGLLVARLATRAAQSAH